MVITGHTLYEINIILQIFKSINIYKYITLTILYLPNSRSILNIINRIILMAFPLIFFSFLYLNLVIIYCNVVRTNDVKHPVRNTIKSKNITCLTDYLAKNIF